jgi:tetrahydromethanopterin S-methyltransferase subunit D
MSSLRSLLLLVGVLLETSAAFVPVAVRPALMRTATQHAPCMLASPPTSATLQLAALFGPGYESEMGFAKSTAFDSHSGDLTLQFFLLVAFPVAITAFFLKSND